MGAAIEQRDEPHRYVFETITIEVRKGGLDIRSFGEPSAQTEVVKSGKSEFRVTATLEMSKLYRFARQRNGRVGTLRYSECHPKQ